MAIDARKLNAAIAVTRFGLGARPGEIETAAQDPHAWLQGQIRRQGADQPVFASGAPPSFPTVQASGAPMTPDAAMSPMPPAAVASPALMTWSPGQALPGMQASFLYYTAYKQQNKLAKDDPDARRIAAAPLHALADQEILARVQLAATTPAGFRERWALFWANHFTMAAKGLPELVAAGPFEREAIRPHVFGRFCDMLIASSSHPGMLLYLDQAQSVGPNSPAGIRRAGKAGLNENLGREIMELHTVGADAGYTQGDVTEFARALTGWSMGGPNGPSDLDGAYFYRANYHEPGERTVMGKHYPDGGRDQALAVMQDLAASPHTAEHLARKIAVHFVADDPPPSLVAKLKAGYLSSRGDLAQVAATLISAPESWEPAALKFKTPYEYLVSGYRAADASPRDSAREIVKPLAALGQRPFTAPQPNGWSEMAADWAAPDAVVKRLTWAQSFASVYAPQTPPPDEARAILGARLTDKTLTAVSRAETRPEAFAILLMSPEFQRR